MFAHACTEEIGQSRDLVVEEDVAFAHKAVHTLQRKSRSRTLPTTIISQPD
jgi:hypothetical protein